MSVVDGGTVGDYIALLKPRVMSLVIFTAFVGYVLAPGALHPVLGAIAILAVAVGAGASGAINMWYDRDIDAVMARTKGRPIPAGRVNADEALAFGVVLSIGSVVVMGLAVNWLAAGLLALTIVYYVFFYTMWLKRRTSQNIVVGGAAGAFPPMIGWAAATGEVSIESLVLFAIIFMWTPPHFWALALYRSGDYRAAGVPMLPVVAGRAETRRQIFIYSVLLAPLGVAPWWLGFAGPFYGSVAAVLGGVFLLGAMRVWRDDQERHCRQLFGFSILYLFAIFAMLLVDRGIAVL
ncbi:MAG: heme o synthase [Pseudomonadota bacterium]|nr:heme o synthase [Pseudomonadota bacterium]